VRDRVVQMAAKIAIEPIFEADFQLTGHQLYGMGLHRLMGTVPYPAQATPRRSSLSRGPENGMHGLKGDAMEPGQPC